MNIAFCINRLALIGLGPTISSLIRNCSNPTALRLYILCAHLTADEKGKIEHLLHLERFTGSYKLLDFDPDKEFGNFRSLHGDWTPYGRLLLPELLDEDQVLYLDADLIVQLDILTIENCNLQDRLIAAVKGGPIKNTLENSFYLNKIGLAGELDSFNSGVLLMNLDEWRRQNTKAQCIELAKKYPMDLLSCDQSILNALFAGNFIHLPAALNCPWYAGKQKPAVAEKMILHFVGSPKPWDPLASLFHEGYTTWKLYLNNYWNKNFNYFNLLKLKRAWNIRKAYVRSLLK